MRWEDERYVRVYTRDTIDWVALGWEAQALFVLLLRKADRSGVVEMSRLGVRGLAALLRMPPDVVERSLPTLLEDGCVTMSEDQKSLIIRNFIDAQEATSSAKLRQRESRERHREKIRLGLDPSAHEAVIYFVQPDGGTHIKVGFTEDLARRIQNMETSTPHKMVLLATIRGSVADERAIHSALSEEKERGEWFNRGPLTTAAIEAAKEDGATASTIIHAITRESTRVTNRDGETSRGSGDVTDVTDDVTPYRTVPYRAVPYRAVPEDPGGGGSNESKTRDERPGEHETTTAILAALRGHQVLASVAHERFACTVAERYCREHPRNMMAGKSPTIHPLADVVQCIDEAAEAIELDEAANNRVDPDPQWRVIGFVKNGPRRRPTARRGQGSGDSEPYTPQMAPPDYESFSP